MNVAQITHYRTYMAGHPNTDMYMKHYLHDL